MTLRRSTSFAIVLCAFTAAAAACVVAQDMDPVRRAPMLLAPTIHWEIA